MAIVNHKSYFINQTAFLCLILLATLGACQRKSIPNAAAKKTADSLAVARKDSTKSKPVAVVQKKDTTDELKVNVETINFRYLTAKSKVSFKSHEQNFENANLSLRIKKDSIIWISVNYAAIEVARGIITRDSIQFLNRVQGEYYAYDFEGLSKLFDFKLSYSLVQSILIGNMPIPKKPNQRFKREKDYLLLKQEEGKVLIDNYIGEQNRRLKKLLVTDQPTKNTLTLDYEDFTALNNYLFPFSSLVQLNYKSQKDNMPYETVFRIKHQKIELLEQPLSFPFSIPSKLKKK